VLPIVAGTLTPDHSSSRVRRVLAGLDSILAGNVVYVRDLGEAEDFRLTTWYPESRWWRLRGHQVTELHR